MKGKLWFTDGVHNIRLLVGEEIPDGYYRGRTVSEKFRRNARKWIMINRLLQPRYQKKKEK